MVVPARHRYKVSLPEILISQSQVATVHSPDFLLSALELPDIWLCAPVSESAQGPSTKAGIASVRNGSQMS